MRIATRRTLRRARNQTTFYLGIARRALTGAGAIALIVYVIVSYARP